MIVVQLYHVSEGSYLPDEVLLKTDEKFLA